MKIGILCIVVGTIQLALLKLFRKNNISHLKPPMFNPNSVQNLLTPISFNNNKEPRRGWNAKRAVVSPGC